MHGSAGKIVESDAQALFTIGRARGAVLNSQAGLTADDEVNRLKADTSGKSERVHPRLLRIGTPPSFARHEMQDDISKSQLSNRSRWLLNDSRRMGLSASRTSRKLQKTPTASSSHEASKAVAMRAAEGKLCGISKVDTAMVWQSAQAMRIIGNSSSVLIAVSQARRSRRNKGPRAAAIENPNGANLDAMSRTWFARRL
ncbi:uncharacterized protein PG998_002562 [Apiospora kogelbergensis]|uniref:uncharacterized protein n=1 Tax=Apiospora kogelbergensis TaxID=1337665 RepID=UPI003130F92F